MLCLVGNKCDLVDGRQVQTEEAQEYADSIDALFFETSALKNTGGYTVYLIWRPPHLKIRVNSFVVLDELNLIEFRYAYFIYIIFFKTRFENIQVHVGL